GGWRNADVLSKPCHCRGRPVHTESPRWAEMVISDPACHVSSRPAIDPDTSSNTLISWRAGRQ
ncbi:hypothetical protein BaRGS_00033662, partial [Batillaria attramentaria]